MAPTTRSQARRRAVEGHEPSPSPEPYVPRRRARPPPLPVYRTGGRMIDTQRPRTVAMMRAVTPPTSRPLDALRRVLDYRAQRERTGASLIIHDYDTTPIATRTRSRFDPDRPGYPPRNVNHISYNRQPTPIYIQARRHAVSRAPPSHRRVPTHMRRSPSGAVASMDALLRIFSSERARMVTSGRFISVDEMMDNIHGRQVDVIDPDEVSEDEESDAEASTSAVVEPEPKKRRGRPPKGGKGRGRKKPSDEPVRLPTLDACTICCEEIPKRPVACRHCRQPIGCRYCVKKWFRTTNLSHLDARPPFAMSVSHRNHHSCPLCRAPWNDTMEVIRVVNADGIPFASEKDVSMDTSDVPGPSQVRAI
uniref:RING-type domain-containing protein n=1 Tax=Panagrellus redivivus TaxID=6233 RepID=A0A7E4ZSQ4_PANRE